MQCRRGDLRPNSRRCRPVASVQRCVQRAGRSICVALLLTKVKEQPAGGPAANHLVHYVQRVVIGIRARDRLGTDEQIGLNRIRPRDKIDSRTADIWRVADRDGRCPRLFPTRQFRFDELARVRHRNVARDHDRGLIGNVVPAVEFDKILARDSVKRSHSRRDARRRMCAVHGT